MTEVMKQGFMFMKLLDANSTLLRPHVNWDRRWFLLHRNGTLICYDSYSAHQQMFEFNLKSLSVSRDDVMFPDAGSGKPWIISVFLRKQDGKRLLLETDCEECMDKWAQLILDSLTHTSSSVQRVNTPPVSKKPLVPGINFHRELNNQFTRRQSPLPMSPKPTQKSHPDDPTTEASYHDISKDTILSPVHGVEMRNVIDRQTFEHIVSNKNRQEMRMSRYVQPMTPPSVPRKKLPPPPLKPKTKNLSQIIGSQPANDASSKDALGSSHAQPTTNSTNQFNYYILQPDTSIFLACDCPQTRAPVPRPDTPSFLAALPDFSQLLKDYWPIYVILPNQKVYKQLVNFSLPVQDSLQLLLNCFEHSYTIPSSFLIVQVVGELYQTYRKMKYSLFDCRKRIQFVDWKKSFSTQGVLTGKIIKITFRVGVSATLDSDKLSDFLYTVNNLSDTELFSMSFVCFVKGIFPIREESVSKTLTAFICLIHKRISGNKCIDAPKFTPSCFQGVSSHLKSIQTEADSMTCDTVLLYDSFMETLNSFPSGNAISFPIVIIKRRSNGLKHINCIFMVSGSHIGVSEVENGVNLKNDAIPKFWHFSEIHGWFVQPADDAVFIQLDRSLESSNNLIFLSANSDFIDCLFSQCLGIK